MRKWGVIPPRYGRKLPQITESPEALLDLLPFLRRHRPARPTPPGLPTRQHREQGRAIGAELVDEIRRHDHLAPNLAARQIPQLLDALHDAGDAFLLALAICPDDHLGREGGLVGLGDPSKTLDLSATRLLVQLLDLPLLPLLFLLADVDFLEVAVR